LNASAGANAGAIQWGWTNPVETESPETKWVVGKCCITHGVDLLSVPKRQGFFLFQANTLPIVFAKKSPVVLNQLASRDRLTSQASRPHMNHRETFTDGPWQSANLSVFKICAES
jgi:hypothetical protein